MSGGVDSAVAAALLRDQGYEVIGATLKLWCSGETSRTGRTCCSLDDIADARSVAARLGIRHYVLDMQDEFATHVVEPFVAAYLAGETPNPCVACNTELKFGELARAASQLGAEFIATGHHARRATGPDGEPAVARAKDRTKDQSYVLWGVPAAVLARVLLPVGELTKSEVRAAARGLGLEVAEKRDSQDICFVTRGRYADFVRARAAAEIRPGPIVDQEGHLRGQHAGIVDFTVGQRRGLKLGGGERSYVTAIDAATATVHVGPRAALATRTLRLRGVNWQRTRRPATGESFLVQVRSSAEPVPARVVDGAEGRLRIALETPIAAAVSGQSGALYEGDRLAGGGILASPC
jgi:tRNA-specific 2-thiouridylase